MKFIINFKTYKQGKNAVRLAKEIGKIDKKVIIGVQASDVYEIAKATKLKVYVQHVDYQKQGRATGFVLPEAVKKDGAKGVFLNHSEHSLRFDVLKKTIKRCKDLGLETAVFVPNLKKAKQIEKLKTDFLIIEPPELVAGKVSVSKGKPDLIKIIAENLNRKFLVGAGIHSKKDVKTALNLGASGVVVSSSVAKAKNPGKKLRELISN